MLVIQYFAIIAHFHRELEGKKVRHWRTHPKVVIRLLCKTRKQKNYQLGIPAERNLPKHTTNLEEFSAFPANIQ